MLESTCGGLCAKCSRIRLQEPALFGFPGHPGTFLGEGWVTNRWGGDVALACPGKLGAVCSKVLGELVARDGSSARRELEP